MEMIPKTVVTTKDGSIVVMIQDTEPDRMVPLANQRMTIVGTSQEEMMPIIMDLSMVACPWRAIPEICVNLQPMHDEDRIFARKNIR